MAYAKAQSGLILPADMVQSVQVRRVKGRYDAAQTTSENSRHWANADALSPDAGLSPAIRRTIRNRARYEVANNSYAKGMVLTMANDLIGSGPRLNMVGPDKTLNAAIELRFNQWAKAIRLAQKLRVMRQAKAVDGETFGVMAQNRQLASPVKLDVKLYEAEQFASPTSELLIDTVDGIVFDEYGNPVYYWLLRDHPGSTTGGSYGAADKIPAEHVIHWYRVDRAGQSRGVCEIASSLPLFAQLRRYTLAVLGAAETAADFAAVLQMQAPPDGSASIVEPMETINLEPRMMTVLPEGGTLEQIDSKQPTTTYPEFKRCILGEIARCENIPVNVILGDSSESNYASGRLDYQVYYKSIRIEQSDLEGAVLDRILRRWLNEAILISDYLPVQARNVDRLEWKWMWDGNEHVDPQKEANAQDTKLKNGSTTLAKEYARTGQDWQNETQQWIDEIKFIADGLGITPAEYLKLTTVSRPQPEPQGDNNG